MNMLGAESPMGHILDVPWRLGGHEVPWLSSQIGVMVLATGILLLGLLGMALRRVGQARHRSMGMIELIVLFVRKYITEPAMGPGGDKALPIVATLFVFLLTCNLLGMVPLKDVSSAVGLEGYGGLAPDGGPMYRTPVGGTPTSALWVPLPLAGLALVCVMLGSYLASVRKLWKGPAHAEGHGHPAPAGMNLWLGLGHWLEGRRWPLPAAAVFGLYTWLNSFVPPVSGVSGLILWPMLLVIEFVGYIARCAALAIRLLANMTSGHILLAVLLGFAVASRGWMIPILGLPIGLGMLAMMLLELLAAVVQAYIFTFLATMYVSLATNPRH